LIVPDFKVSAAARFIAADPFVVEGLVTPTGSLRTPRSAGSAPSERRDHPARLGSGALG